MSVIQAGNTTTTSLIYTGDTTGNLVFTTGGANTVALTLANTQAATFANNVTITGTSTHTGNASFSNITASGTLTTASQGIAFASLPTGSVLQVVQATYNSSASNSGGALTTSGLTASITPKFSTSKVLVMITTFGRVPTGGWGQISLYKNGSNLLQFWGGFLYNNQTGSTLSIPIDYKYLDSPATTSSTTYAMFFAGVNVTFQINPDGQTSTMILMEIAA